MRLTTILLAGTLALSSSCGTAYLGPETMVSRTVRSPEKIRDDSKFGEYFISGKYKKSSLKREKGIASELERRIESSMGNYFKREVDAQTPYHRQLGHTTFVSERGELTIRDEYHVMSKLSNSEQKAMVYLAERKSLRSFIRGFHKSKEFKRLAETLKIKGNLEQLNQHFGVSAKPKFAAAVGEIKGFAPYFLILLDEDPLNLYDQVNVWAHEDAHTFFFVTGGVYESMFRNLPINETACDFIGNRIAAQFRKDHIPKGSKLDKMYVKQKASRDKLEKIVKEVSNKYHKYSVRERREKRDEVMKSLEKYSVSRGVKLTINEAKLAIWDRYSGSEKRYGMLEDIEKIVGPNRFLDVVPKLFNDKELEITHATFKKHGKKAFWTVMYELDKLHYVDLSDSVL